MADKASLAAWGVFYDTSTFGAMGGLHSDITDIQLSSISSQYLQIIYHQSGWHYTTDPKITKSCSKILIMASKNVCECSMTNGTKNRTTLKSEHRCFSFLVFFRNEVQAFLEKMRSHNMTSTTLNRKFIICSESGLNKKTFLKGRREKACFLS